MCGIFTLLNNTYDIFNIQFIKDQFDKGKGRGPEFSILKNVMIKADFGFHRLAINGMNPKSNQPIIIQDIALICNGEIYNYKELYNIMNIKPKTDSDCEVILHLYMKYGIEQTLQMLDGVFSFVLIDYRIMNETSKVYVARDPYGVRPLYYLKPGFSITPSDEILSSKTYPIYGFASELKMLSEIRTKLNNVSTEKAKLKLPMYTIEQFTPGTYSVFELGFKANASWNLKKLNTSYHTIGFHTNISFGPNTSLQHIYENIQYYLKNAVEKRCCTTERPIACLLSGGLDSSLIAALVNDYHIKHNLPTLETYSIGLPESEDLKYARIVADYLGTKHTEILLTENDFLDAIPEVIKAIESYDTTSVRASIGNWLLGKYISEHSEAKVIFNGDGSDELAGGYLYMNCAPDSIEFDRECRRLLKNIYAFDVLRSDKSISSHGLEPRTPFLDRTWVQYYMTIPMDVRFHKNSENMEKYLIRNSFSAKNYKSSLGTPLLPEEVLFRRKEAFSDGVSKTTRSLFEIIKEYTEEKFVQDDYPYFFYKEIFPGIYEEMYKFHPTMTEVNDYLPPKTAEQFYYRKIFETYYSGLGEIVPYFWMPKYVEASDASARTLKIYNNEK